MVSTLYRFDKNGDQPEYKAPEFGGLKLEELRKFRHIMFIFKINGRIFGGYCEWVNWNGFVSGEKTYLFFINELFNKRSKL